MQNFRIKLPTNGSLPKLAPLVVPLVILMLSDSILSYAVPIYSRNLFENDFLAGLVISFSSLIGLAFDYLSKRLFGRRNFSFFIKLTFILSVVFAYSLGLSFVNKYIFIFSMAIWGIYYETLAFSNFKFLKNHVSSHDYSFSWCLINMTKSLIYGVGPLIAAVLLAQNLKLPPYLCGSVVMAVFFMYLTLFHKERHPKEQYSILADSRSEFKVWLVLLKKIYPIWILNLILVIIDAGFWTVGVLMSDSLGKTSSLAKFIIPLYMLPAVIFSPLSQNISARYGKKRTAIISSLFGAGVLAFMGMANGINQILLSVFAYSMFVSIAFPAIYATFEDFVSRLGSFDTDFIGLEQSSSSLAYIIGPVFAGFVSMQLTEQKVFLVFGIILALVSLVALIITPRKIKMPQSELLNLA